MKKQLKNQMIICKEFTFAAAHKLTHYAGKCSNLHGHNYKIQICIKGKVEKNGLVLDLMDVKSIVTKNVLDIIDHKYLNEIMNQPSIENISIWVWNQLKEHLPLHEIKVWETETGFAIYSG